MKSGAANSGISGPGVLYLAGIPGVVHNYGVETEEIPMGEFAPDLYCVSYNLICACCFIPRRASSFFIWRCLFSCRPFLYKSIDRRHLFPAFAFELVSCASIYSGLILFIFESTSYLFSRPMSLSGEKSNCYGEFHRALADNRFTSYEKIYGLRKIGARATRRKLTEPRGS